MTDKKKSSNKSSSKVVKVDTKKIIKTKPVMVRENFSRTEKRKSENKEHTNKK